MPRRTDKRINPNVAPTIILPGQVEETRKLIAVCRVPTGDSEICGIPFYAGEESMFQRHVGDCASRHQDAIRAASPLTRFPMTDPQQWDPEVDEHMGKVGKDMKREGRLTVKPNEKAGF